MKIGNDTNKRRGNRRGLFYYLRAIRASDGHLVGHLVNLTESGLMLMMEQPPSPGDHLAILLELPPGFDTWSPLSLDLVCRWTRPSVTPGWLDAGFELLERKPLQLDVIRRLLNEVGFSGA